MSVRSQRRRRKKAFARHTPPGTAPGTLVADPNALPPKMEIIAYGPNGFVEHEGCNFEILAKLRQQYPVVWVNIDGLGDTKVVEKLGQTFGLHPLALEDVLHTHQRSKVEHYPDNIYVVARMLNPRS